ncbi:MAG: radical SAM protein [Kiritimatiellae bacterium]|nr:radical SAM protein [Kiritimatiellia bacterium]
MITVIAKPTHDCNLRCGYCYIEPGAERGRMDERTALNVMEGFARHSHDHRAHFIWHGGEPLLCGIAFFEFVADITASLKKRGYHVTNAIQTNGTLLGPDFLDFVSDVDDFRLGFSLDGPQRINDRTRPYATGASSFNDTLRAIRMTRERNSRTRHLGGGVIVVLSKANIADMKQVLQFFNEERIGFKVNPLIRSGRARHGEYDIDPTEAAAALHDLFNYWMQSDSMVSVDPFVDFIGSVASGCSVGCNHAGNCRERYVSVGPLGDIYPCGRFDGVKSMWMGNVNTPNGVTDAYGSSVHQRLLGRNAKNILECSDCVVSDQCKGGCLHNAWTAGDALGKDPYCPMYHRLFTHVRAVLQKELRNAEVGNET